MHTEIGSKRVNEVLPLIATIIAFAHGEVVDWTNVNSDAIAVDSVRGGITLLDTDDWRVALAIYYATLQQGTKVAQYGGKVIHKVVGTDGVKLGSVTFDQLVQMRLDHRNGFGEFSQSR